MTTAVVFVVKYFTAAILLSISIVLLKIYGLAQIIPGVYISHVILPVHCKFRGF